LRTRLAPEPGVPALLKELVKRQFKLALVSSSQSWMIEYILSRLGLEGFFSVTVSANEVKNQKPEPEAYLLALARLGIPATAAVVVEDSETGVMAAVRAGIPVIAVRNSLNKKHNLSQASAIMRSLDDVPGAIRTIENSIASSRTHAIAR
jgi:HAD superfamily hydrolase (TIGR01509 family)